MTHREAMKIALTELGLSKREIWRRLEFADREAGFTGGKHLALKPGVTERDHIDELKASYRRFRALPLREQAEVFGKVQEQFRRRIEGN